MKYVFRFIGLTFVALVVCVSMVAAFGTQLFTFGERGSGTLTSEIRELESFSKISLVETGTINVSFGEEQIVSITTDDNLIDMVETQVVDGTLQIQPTDTISPSKALTIDITIPTLDSVDLTGVAILNMDDVTLPSLKISLTGNSGVTASGSVTDLKLDLTGACRASLKKLIAENAVVEITGTGSAVVSAIQSIDAEATGFASITCHGNPKKVKKETNGMSRVTISD